MNQRNTVNIGEHRLSESKLYGNLNIIRLTDIIQFLSASEKNGELSIVRESDGRTGKLYFAGGNLVNVYAAENKGLAGLAEIIDWDEGEFKFVPNVTHREKNVNMPSNHAIMKAARLRDELANGTDDQELLLQVAPVQQQPEEPVVDIGLEGEEQNNRERRHNMEDTNRDSLEIMGDLLKVVGVDAVVIVGRDGFVIDTSGSSTRLNIDELGASLAHAVNALEEMGQELAIEKFQDMFIEYGRAVILCKPVGDAIAAVLTPDASKLGIIRHKIRTYIEELAQLF